MSKQRWENLYNQTFKMKAGELVTYSLIRKHIGKNRHSGNYRSNIQIWQRGMKKLGLEPKPFPKYGYILMDNKMKTKLRLERWK